MNLTPFQRNAKGEKLDLNNPEDVQLTIERNNILSLAVQGSLSIHKIKFKASVLYTFQCLKCGHDVEIQKSIEEDGAGIGIDYDDLFHGSKCKYCNTTYEYHWEKGVIIARLKHELKLKPVSNQDHDSNTHGQ